MLSAALCASCTCQNTMASTLTGTVSRVSACSALKPVVWMRSSITAVMASTIGMIRNRPGPFTLDSLPRRRITKRSQLFAILSENIVSSARMPKPTPGRSMCAVNSSPPITAKTMVSSEVMGFMGKASVFLPAEILRACRGLVLEVGEAIAQQRAGVISRLERLLRADVVEPGDDARQILPAGQTEIVHAHQRRHHRHVG